MGVYIKGTTKEELEDWLWSHGVIWDSRDIIDVPEPHGRLICADEVGWAKNIIPKDGCLTQYEQGWNDGVDYMLGEIDETPTIVEESKRGTAKILSKLRHGYEK